MIKIVSLIISSILISVSITAQDIPVVSSGEIQYYVDQASFKGKDDKTIQEIYLMTFTDQFSTASDTISMKIHLKMKDNRNKTILNDDWTTYSRVSDSSMKKQMSITDEYRNEILPGDYKFEITLTDSLTGKTGETKFNLKIPDFSDEKMSRIKFVNTSEKNDSGKLIVKPNPSRRYGVLNPVLSVYYEIYPNNIVSDNLTINYSVIDEDKKVVKKLPSATVKNKRSSMAISHGFDVSNVPSGIYNLLVSIKDDTGQEFAALTRHFEIIQFDYTELKPAISKEQAEESGRLIKILSPAKYSIYDNLNLQGKANFLINFWRELDPSPGTTENEYFSRIMERYHYANHKFSWGKEKGWESDRGRVMIQYGNPDAIDAHYAEPETSPYEIWHYTKDRNYMFVFADPQSNGHFVLVHSNKEGEIKNSYWKNSLQK